MNVLSLFDGISCGRMALERAKIKVDNYYASEIDNYAIQISEKNWPDIIRLGDVTKIDLSVLPKIYLVIAGSPCQGFSQSGKQLNFNDPRSKLFFTFVDILKQVKPDYFLLENVKMKKEWQDIISSHLGVEPVLIDSSLVSAQSRKRLYWANFPITQPKDKGILLKDIIESGTVDRDKSYCVDANYFKGGSLKNYYEKKRRQIVLTQSERRLMVSEAGYRKLTPIECERLQTLDDGYTEGISNTQRYKCLGNGFTVDVIAHIFACLRREMESI